MEPSNRLCFLDNLRAFVIILVVVLHGSITYMAYAPAWWYVLDPQNSEFFTQLVLLIDVPIMPILFFLAGYFAVPALQKRGPRSFLKGKFIRIGLPWIFGALFLAPIITYMIYFSRGVPMGFFDFWRTDFWGPLFQQSVYWFLGVLLLMFVVLVWVNEWSDRLRGTQRIVWPTGKVFAAFIMLVSAGFLIISLSFGPDAWWHNYLLVYQPVRVPLYIGYFALGIYADRYGWFMTDGYKPELGPWGWGCVLTGLAYLAFRWGVANTPAATLPVKIGTAWLYNTFCFTALIAGVALFQRKIDSAGKVWASLAANSYGIYYVHPLILYPLAYVFVGISLPLIVKAPLLIGLAVLLSWAASALLLKKLPLLRKVF